MKASYLRTVQLFSKGDLPGTIEMRSDDSFAAWHEGRAVVDVFGRGLQLGGGISFCYLDGSHAEAQVRRDFLNCDQFLVPGGFLVFDDSADGSGWDVCRVVAEVQRSRRYELVIKNPNYLFKKTAELADR